MHGRAGRWLPPLALMALIFALSAQPNLSSGLGLIDLVGRKIVHMAEFGALCALWWRALAPTLCFDRALAAAAAVAVLYAVSDEWHQTFTEGRHGSPWDVAIDAAGVGLAVLLASRGRRAARRPRAGGPPPAEARTP